MNEERLVEFLKSQEDILDHVDMQNKVNAETFELLQMLRAKIDYLEQLIRNREK